MAQYVIRRCQIPLARHGAVTEKCYFCPRIIDVRSQLHHLAEDDENTRLVCDDCVIAVVLL